MASIGARLARALGLLSWAVAGGAGAAEPAAGTEVVRTVQQLFDAMAARDSSAIQLALLADARIVSLRPDRTMSAMTGAEFAVRIAAAKEPLLERMWQARVLIEGGMATLWAPYDFHSAGRLTHCGTNAVTLFDTAAGWKIAGIQFTVVEAVRCAPSPLGPPAAR